MNISNDEKRVSEKMEYFILGLDQYNKFLRRNLNLEIKDIKKIYSKLTSSAHFQLANYISSVNKAFESGSKNGNKLLPASFLRAHILQVDKENFLISEPVSQKIKDWAIFLATVIPVIVSILDLAVI